MNKVTIIEQEKNVSCLPGYENLDTQSIAKRMPKKQHVKSIKELRFEKEERENNSVFINA